MVITLIGYRGSGKSTLAAPLAGRLGWEWIDADVEIERRAGKTIAAMFSEDGEPAFRQLEREVLADLLDENNLIIAAGGGAILDPSTRQRMRNAGLVVWLRASLETLVQRIFADPTTADRRPNLTATGGRAEVETVLKEREPLYCECAHQILDVDSSSPEELSRTIADWAASWQAEEPRA
ncbi:MAG: shikimate kinase [Planctomycetaceae bacterium]|nr:shikimate kinase [Planctomycetaceae bacterium]